MKYQYHSLVADKAKNLTRQISPPCKFENWNPDSLFHEFDPRSGTYLFSWFVTKEDGYKCDPLGDWSKTVGANAGHFLNGIIVATESIEDYPLAVGFGRLHDQLTEYRVTMALEMIQCVTQQEWMNA